MTEPTRKQKIGKMGEDVACEYLRRHGFEVVERNYWKKWGEIDIVAKKDHTLHFVEVKTVSHAPPHDAKGDHYEPEEMVHPWKRQRLSRVIQTYVLDKKVPDETEYQIDIIAVYLDMDTHKAHVHLLPDVEV